MKKHIFSLLFLASLILTGCENRQTTLENLAKADVLSSLPYPDSTEILDYSPCDSAFGIYWFPEKEVIEILTTMKIVSDSIMAQSENLTNLNPNNNYLVNLTERHMEAASAMRSILMSSAKKGEFTGWKMRVIYETTDKDNACYRCARYLFFNKEESRVIKAFDIPLL